jgi:hypothetical protein
VVDAVTADEGAEVLDREPGDGGALVDGVMSEGFDEMAFAGAVGAGDDQILGSSDPFQAAQGPLGGGGDGRAGLHPGPKGLPVRETGPSPSVLDAGVVSAFDLGGEEHPEGLGRVPALRPGGEDDVGELLAPIF